MNPALMRTLALTILAFSHGLLQAAMAENTAIVRGRVEDPSGQPVLGAEVKLKNKTTHEKFETTSSETGEFTFTNVPEGEYIVSAKAQGLEEAQAAVKVGTTPIRPVRLRLEISEMQEEMTVTDNPLSSPSSGETVD